MREPTTTPAAAAEGLPLCARTVPERVGYYGFAGAEWLGDDGVRYRTNTMGKGVYTLVGARPVPGLQDFKLGQQASAWADEINAALEAEAQRHAEAVKADAIAAHLYGGGLRDA
jgi:hypothetical protein